MSETHRNFIGGDWVAGAETARNINPSDLSDVIGEYARADRAQADAAIGAARAAFPAWSMSSVQDRANLLDAVGNTILARKDELGRLLSREEGKTLPEGIGEVVRAGQIFKFFGGEALRLAGEKIQSIRPGVDVEVTREPLGVIGIITPWNFPVAIPAWKIAPALCYGNCVVFKPAELVPGSAWALSEIIIKAGIPAGVFNLVMGRGSVVGETIINDRRVDAISFTGSVATGRAIAAKAIARMAKLQLEMGGKNPLVVLDDANIHDRFVAALSERLRSLKVDDALTPGTDIGPVVDETQLKQNLDYIGIGQREGAKLAYGGEMLKRAKQGHYLAPALLTEATNAMRTSREEIFGPVASVIRVKDYDEALAVANDTDFGLSAGIVTTSLKHASHFKRQSQAGMIMVNLPTAGVDYHVPFGGRKGSSYGPREQGRYAREFFTVVKTAYTLP